MLYTAIDFTVISHLSILRMTSTVSYDSKKTSKTLRKSRKKFDDKRLIRAFGNNIYEVDNLQNGKSINSYRKYFSGHK